MTNKGVVRTALRKALSPAALVQKTQDFFTGSSREMVHSHHDS